MNLDFIIPLDEQSSMLRIYVVAGSRCNEIVGEYGDPIRLKMKINAIAEDGKANKEIIGFLSKLLGITKSEIEFIRGEISKSKDLKINLKSDELQKKLIEKIKMAPN